MPLKEPLVVLLPSGESILVWPPEGEMSYLSVAFGGGVSASGISSL